MVCRTVSDGNFLRRIKRERGTHPYDTVKEKWYGGSDANVTGTGTTAAGRKASGRTQKPIYRVAFLMAAAVKSAFALLSTKVTKPLPCPAPVTSTEKGRAIEKNHFRNAGSRLPQP